ncbi:hypothetical protein [Acanthopleuribacter pedis]|uniref:Uncharacterized protein n=1 Tax=Acanthopleuribacter pedis TaxID=442870 RepID=A0A8J7U634_9BACT|nr:hypothetical protein [Acanthopleuribacter pedis]MBO1322352.1 hypothetical protein [Acanthopleuribacter pedis]
MGFLDDLDSAFDNIMLEEGESAEPPKEGQVQFSGLDDMGLPNDLRELRQALAGETILPIAALLATLDRGRRAYTLGALRGALDYHLKVENDEKQQDLIKALIGELTTRRGTARQAFLPKQKTRFQEMADGLPKVDLADGPDRVQAFLKLLTKTPETSFKEAEKCFRSGIWETASVEKGSMLELTKLSTMEEHQVAALKAAVAQ